METRTEFGPAAWLRPVAAIASAACGICAAQTPDGAAAPQSVTITATRVATPAFDVPASIDLVTLAPDTDTRPGINISETLGGVPGLLARDRQNYAQDVQISVRGFGARSTFGIRGVRIYIDGIPGTMPDGQGQISNVDLGSAAAVEVLRGPFSALYGNSSGGVVQVFTEDGTATPKWTFGAGAGSNGELRYDGKLTGTEGNLDYVDRRDSAASRPTAIASTARHGATSRTSSWASSSTTAARSRWWPTRSSCRTRRTRWA